MFIIAGISPKTKLLETNPRRCPLCGTNQAYLKRIDHYFSLFFIPLIRVKKGYPVVICDNCDRSHFQIRGENGSDGGWKKGRCKYCGEHLKSDFEYCPYCGRKV